MVQKMAITCPIPIFQGLITANGPCIDSCSFFHSSSSNDDDNDSKNTTAIMRNNNMLFS